MAADPGIKDTYLTQVQDALALRKDKLAKNREQQKQAALEDAAQAALSQADNAALVQAGILDRLDLTVLQADEAVIVTEVQALQNLRAAVKAL